MRYLLGIDIGTTGTKTLLFREDGKLIGSASRAYPLLTPQVGYSEQNAEDWWNATVDTVREVTGGRDISTNVSAISLSTQGGTLVPTDERGDPIRHAIVWNDKRCVKEFEAFEREAAPAGYVYRKTGWKMHNALLALEIRWLKDHEPDTYKNAAKFLSVPDFISMRMTGVAAADMSNLGINQLCDIRREAYDETILRFDGITADRLPAVLHSGDVIGRLTEKAAAALGLSTDTLLVAGAHDQYAAALGAGAIDSGDILVGSGTSWVVTSIGDEPDFESGLAQSVSAVPGKWGSLLSLSSGGVCLEWLRKNVFAGEGELPVDYETVNRETAKRQAAENGLFFCPFSGFAGQGRRFTRASFIGLDLAHDRFDIARAVMEGVAFQIVWMTESFRAKPSEEGFILSGGASKSPVWCQILADIAGLPVRLPEIADLSCVGAAIMAGVGSGVFADVREGYKRFKVAERVVMPDSKRSAVFRPLYEKYKEYAAKLGDMYGSK